MTCTEAMQKMQKGHDFFFWGGVLFLFVFWGFFNCLIFLVWLGFFLCLFFFFSAEAVVWFFTDAYKQSIFVCQWRDLAWSIQCCHMEKFFYKSSEADFHWDEDTSFFHYESVYGPTLQRCTHLCTLRIWLLLMVLSKICKPVQVVYFSSQRFTKLYEQIEKQKEHKLYFF